MTDRPKIFGIGFHKTGTSSLARALTRLGYRVTGPNWINCPDIATEAPRLARERLRAFDAVQDNPWPVLFRRLDRWHQEGRFILTVRNERAWIRSVLRHFGTGTTPMRRWIYGHGSPVGHERTYMDRYRSHNAAVLDYFRDRPDDLLVMDITAGDSWGELCGFLDVGVPNEPFPHANQSTAREWSEIKEGVKRRLRGLRSLLNLGAP